MSDFYNDQNNVNNNQNNISNEPIRETTQEIIEEPVQQPMQSTPEEKTWYSSESSETHYTAPASPAPKKAKKPMNSGTKWALRIVGTVLVAAIAFVSGFAGATMANNDIERVVIQRVEGSAASGSEAVSSGEALSSVQIAQKVTPSVVAITTEQMTTNNFWFGSYVTSGAGSGVIISEDGYIITNSHVVNGATKLSVELSNGTTHDATLVGKYPQGDIAVIKIEATGLTAASIADSDKVLQGETVYAVGNPEGNFSGSISSGIVSAMERQINVSVEDDSQQSQPNTGYPFYGFGGFGSFGYSNYGTASSVATLDVIQFDAAVSPGNSGGGLFNDRGELIGIVCAKSSDADAEGLAFAINGNKAIEIATALMNDGEYIPDPSENTTNASSNKAILGITAAYLNEASAAQYGYKNAGVYVITVSEKSTIDAGLASGDRILGIDDNTVNQVEDVTDYLTDKNPGDVVTLTIEREGRMLDIAITLVENEAYQK